MSDRTFDSRIVEFCERLAGLDAGERARLRRNAGKSLNESRNALPVFYRLLPPGVSDRHEDVYFLVATLHSFTTAGGSGDLGSALLRARTPQNGRGLDRRVQVLLDADLDQLPFRLRQAVQFLRSTRVAVHWPMLLTDLLNWTHPDRFVQKRWARSYFTGTTP